jgi:hypothetical protein
VRCSLFIYRTMKFSIVYRPQWKNFLYNTKWWILIHWYPTDTMYLRYTLTSYWHNDMLFIHADLDLGYESWRGRWASPMRRGLCWGPPSRRRSVGDTPSMWRAQTAHAQNLNKSGKYMALVQAARKSSLLLYKYCTTENEKILTILHQYQGLF